MKSLFASLEPGECRRIEEEFEKLTNESAVDVQDPDAKLEEILAENISSAKNKVIFLQTQFTIIFPYLDLHIFRITFNKIK
jgi:hypothetical protein